MGGTLRRRKSMSSCPPLGLSCRWRVVAPWSSLASCQPGRGFPDVGQRLLKYGFRLDETTISKKVVFRVDEMALAASAGHAKTPKSKAPESCHP